MKKWTTYALVLAAFSAYAQIPESGLDEMTSDIAEINGKENRIVLGYLEDGQVEYRLALGAEITLSNGEPGALSQLQKDDAVSIVYDTQSKTIYKVFVLED